MTAVGAMQCKGDEGGELLTFQMAGSCSPKSLAAHIHTVYLVVHLCLAATTA